MHPGELTPASYPLAQDGAEIVRAGRAEAPARASATRRGRLQDGLALAVLIVLPALYLKEIPGGVPPYGGDVLVHVYPLMSLLAHGLHAGRPVLWNFYAAGGYPLAPYSALSLDPPVVLALLALPVSAAIAALYALALAVFGVGMYLLGGDLNLSRPARLLAACTLAYGGFVAAHVYAGHLFELDALSPLPLAVLLLRRAIRRGSIGYAVGCGALVGLMILAAGLQFLPFGLVLLPLLALWHTALRVRNRRQAAWPPAGQPSAGQSSGRRLPAAWRAAAWPPLALAIAGLVAAALGAVLLLPFREILGATLRAAPVDLKTAAAQSLPSWQGLAMLVAPGAFGNAAAGTYWPASRFGPYFHEIYAYAGLLPLLLAPVALLRRPASRPYGAVAVLAVLVMLGGDTSLYPLLYHLPGASLLRAPARAGIALDFALALLAGFGLDALRFPAPDGTSVTRASYRRSTALLVPGAALAVAVLVGLLVASGAGDTIPPAGRAIAVAAALRLGLLLLAALAACLVVAWNESRATGSPRAAGVTGRWIPLNYLALLVPAVAILDLATANGALLRPDDPARYYRLSPAVDALLRANGSYRVLALDNAVPPGLGMVTRRVYDVQDFAPLALADYWRLSHPSLVQRARGEVVPTGRDVIRDADPFFLRLFGVRMLLSPAPLQAPPLRLVGHVVADAWTVPGGASWNVDRRQGTSLVYRDDAALPRVWVVPRAMYAPSAAAALTALQRGSVDPAHTAVLSPAPAAPSGPLGAMQRAWAAWLGGGENGLTVRMQGPAHGGYLLIDDGWFPGWVATVDGHDTPVFRADYLLRAVRLPPGRHTVRLVYAPPAYLLGATITLVTALALLVYAGLAALRRVRRNGRHHAAAPSIRDANAMPLEVPQ